MKTTVSRSFFAALIIGLTLVAGTESKAQLSTASALVSNHDINHFINSVEEYAQVENSITELSTRLHDAYTAYPNLKYTASYNNDELIGFVVTGVKDSKEANNISLILMQLEVLGEIVNAADSQFLPNDNSASSRVSRKVARM